MSRKGSFYDALLLVSVILIIVPWLMFAWEATTGVTVARRSLGRNSTPQNLASTRGKAVGFTLIFAPVAVWCFLARRQERRAG